MSNELYDFSVPVFLRGHDNLAELLRKAAAHAVEHKIAHEVILGARLFPDMLPLTRQVQIACDTSKRAVGRLLDMEPPRYDDDEASFNDLFERIRKTSEFIERYPIDAFINREEHHIEIKFGSDPIILTAQQYLARFALPNFYFHITTAYDILRHNGVNLGKRDYLGNIAG